MLTTHSKINVTHLNLNIQNASTRVMLPAIYMAFHCTYCRECYYHYRILIDNDSSSLPFVEGLNKQTGSHNSNEVYVVSESGTKWAFEVEDTLETTTLLPGGSIIVLSYL